MDTELFVGYHRDKGVTVILGGIAGKFIEQVFSEGDDTSKVIPTFVIPGTWGKEFWQSLVDEIDTRDGIKPTSEQGLKGRLEATVKHLEDMRTLVFNKKEGRKNT